MTYTTKTAARFTGRLESKFKLNYFLLFLTM